MGCPVRASHNSTVPSCVPVTTSDPSGLNEAQEPRPLKVSVSSGWPEIASQTFAVPSREAVTSLVPSALNWAWEILS